MTLVLSPTAQNWLGHSHTSGPWSVHDSRFLQRAAHHGKLGDGQHHQQKNGLEHLEREQSESGKRVIIRKESKQRYLESAERGRVKGATGWEQSQVGKMMANKETNATQVSKQNIEGGQSDSKECIYMYTFTAA